MAIFTTFFTVAQNHNVVLTLSKVVQINFEVDNFDLTLFNVVNCNTDVLKVVLTLIYGFRRRDILST